jgi:hypothetical protein
MPIDDADLLRFDLPAPNRTEQRLQSALGRVWNLYRLNYRMQAGLFGTSTRVHLYMHKRDFAHLFRVRLLQPESLRPAGAAGISVRAPRKAGPMPAANETKRIMIELAKLARARGKRVVFLMFELDGSPPRDAAVGAFNAAFAPYAETAIVHLPSADTIDGQHPNPAAAARIAELLAQYERGRR